MKTFTRIIQLLVGVLFILSGLVKANDPLGLSYKMQEFFELWNSGLQEGHFIFRNRLIQLFDFFHLYSLALSVGMIALEIVTGVALLIGWKKKFILFLLLGLILFFTFLTGYAYLSGKFTNCGCFGDCLPITPLTSFVKDLVLLTMIIWLLVFKNNIQPISTPHIRSFILLTCFLISCLFQWYSLHFLPPADCLPFKNGNQIAEQMKAPQGALSDSTAIRYIYEKGGKRFEWAPQDLPIDFETYTYINRIDKVIRKGNAEPRIKGFTLTDTLGHDHTSEVLGQNWAVLVFAMDDEKISWLKELEGINIKAKQNHVSVGIVTSNQEKFTLILSKNHLDIPVYACDYTVIRTAARTDPTVLLLKKGMIVNKYSKRELNQVIKDF